MAVARDHVERRAGGCVGEAHFGRIAGNHRAEAIKNRFAQRAGQARADVLPIGHRLHHEGAELAAHHRGADDVAVFVDLARFVKHRVGAGRKEIVEVIQSVAVKQHCAAQVRAIVGVRTTDRDVPLVHVVQLAQCETRQHARVDRILGAGRPVRAVPAAGREGLQADDRALVVDVGRFGVLKLTSATDLKPRAVVQDRVVRREQVPRKAGQLAVVADALRAAGFVRFVHADVGDRTTRPNHGRVTVVVRVGRPAGDLPGIVNVIGKAAEARAQIHQRSDAALVPGDRVKRARAKQDVGFGRAHDLATIVDRARKALFVAGEQTEVGHHAVVPQERATAGRAVAGHAAGDRRPADDLARVVEPVGHRLVAAERAEVDEVIGRGALGKGGRARGDEGQGCGQE